MFVYKIDLQIFASCSIDDMHIPVSRSIGQTLVSSLHPLLINERNVDALIGELCMNVCFNLHNFEACIFYLKLWYAGVEIEVVMLWMLCILVAVLL